MRPNEFYYLVAREAAAPLADEAARQLDMARLGADVGDTFEGAGGEGFLREPHDELYPCLFPDGGETIPGRVREALKGHLLDALGKAYHQPDDWVTFTVYGSALTYNWDEAGDADVQVWVDADRYNEIHTDDQQAPEDLLADVRRIVGLVNFPTFKELGLTAPADSGADGSMLIQYYAKLGKGSDEENLAQKPYACYRLDDDEWLVRPEKFTPQFYGDWFILVEPKASDVATQALALIEDLERSTVDALFWERLYGEHRNPKYKTQEMAARAHAEAARLGVKNVFLALYRDRQEAYSEQGRGIEDERDMTHKLLEVWGVWQRLEAAVKAKLPWEEQEMPEPPSDPLSEGADRVDRVVDSLPGHAEGQGGEQGEPDLTDRQVDHAIDALTENRPRAFSSLYRLAEGVGPTEEVTEDGFGTGEMYSEYVKPGQRWVFTGPDGTPELCEITEVARGVTDPALGDPGYVVYVRWMTPHHAGRSDYDLEDWYDFVRVGILEPYEVHRQHMVSSFLDDDPRGPELTDWSPYYRPGETWVYAAPDKVGSPEVFRIKSIIEDRSFFGQRGEVVEIAYLTPPAEEVESFEDFRRKADDGEFTPLRVWQQAHLSFVKTAAWGDLMNKAQRLRGEGRVHVLSNGYNHVVGRVEGDHGTYTTMFDRQDPNSRAITTWNCECPWNTYAWQRTRQWKKYEGRPCSHVLALYWQSLSSPAQPATQQGEQPALPGMEPALTAPPTRPFDQQQPFGQPTPGTPYQYPTPPPAQQPMPGGPFPPTPAPAELQQPPRPDRGPDRIDPRFLKPHKPGEPSDVPAPSTPTPGGTSNPQPPGPGGTVHFPGALSRVAAVTTEDVPADFVPEYQGVGFSGTPVRFAVHDGSMEPTQQTYFEDPTLAAFADVFEEGDYGGTPWVLLAYITVRRDQRGKGLARQIMQAVYDAYPDAIIKWGRLMDDAIVHLRDDFRQRFPQRTSAYDNGDKVRTNFPLVGLSPDGTSWRVPRNAYGEVLVGDDDTTIAIFPLKTGPLGEHLVKCQVPTGNLTPVTGSPFIRRRGSTWRLSTGEVTPGYEGQYGGDLPAYYTIPPGAQWVTWDDANWALNFMTDEEVLQNYHANADFFLKDERDPALFRRLLDIGIMPGQEPTPEQAWEAVNAIWEGDLGGRGWQVRVPQGAEWIYLQNGYDENLGGPPYEFGSGPPPEGVQQATFGYGDPGALGDSLRDIRDHLDGDVED